MISLPKNYRKGFTLLEMAVSIGIFGIISAVVIFNHGKFNSSIVVTNLSYEVALAVREAQVYGLAVKQDPNNPVPVEYAYGVYFAEARPKMFYIFADRDGDQQFDPTGDPCNGTDECQEVIEIRGDVNVEDLKTWVSGSYQDTDELTILFLRPNPVAIIRDDDNSGASVSGRERAMIELASPRAEKSKFILVELSGQVSVVDES
jgi:prepilin-type N-terminal cleavage/methylation domain-containing protein